MHKLVIAVPPGKNGASTWAMAACNLPRCIASPVNDEDLIYAFDSESDNVDNPGFEQGIRIGDALNGWVSNFILDQGGHQGTRTGSGPEFGTVDKFGNIFAGEPRQRVLRKYVKVR